MVNKQGVHPFVICLFVVVPFYSFYLFTYFLRKSFCCIFLVNIQDALLLKKGETRTCFCGVFSVSCKFLKLVKMYT